MTDELRAKFEAFLFEEGWLAENDTVDYGRPDIGRMWASYQAANASRDAEVEALQDALFQISVRLKAEREPGMDDMSWHTDMMARAQYLANVEAEAETQRQRIESARMTTVRAGINDEATIYQEELPPSWIGKRVRLVVDDM